MIRLVRWGGKCFCCQGGRLAGGNATLQRKEYVERTCEGVNVQRYFDEGGLMRVVGCLYWMSRRPRLVGYVYDGTRVNQLRLLGPVVTGNRGLAFCSDLSGK